MAEFKLLSVQEKTDLKVNGLWGDFLALKTSRIQKGVKNAVAERDAFCEISHRLPQKPSTVCQSQLEIAPAELFEKKAQPLVVVDWVCNNFDNENPDPEDCPDPKAWLLLRLYGKDDASKRAFCENYWMKVLGKSATAPADDGPKEIDGSGTIDILLKIQAIGNRANFNSGVAQSAACVVHNHEVEGSSPSSATIEEGL